MAALHPDLRRQLEKTVTDARDLAEDAARAALERLAVREREPHRHLTADERALRNRLRAKARQLGDPWDERTRVFAALDKLTHEVAYEQWHRMLFARFLAENRLLIHPELNVAVTLAECEELAKDEATNRPGGRSGGTKIDAWTVAGRFAAGMLPQIFRPDDAALQVALAPEHHRGLEALLESLPVEVFTADDSLGWVYQFWQTKRKDEVNKRGDKITGDTLPAVTQLFTEDYMVLFLLHNTLGAWWAGKVDAASSRVSHATSEAEARVAVALPGINWEYLRFVKVEAASSRLESTRQDAASTFFDPQADITNLSGNLPHWRQDGVTYFVTFRTDDSIPQDKLQEWTRERDQWLAAHPEPHDADTRREYHERFPARLQEWLDAGFGACLLARPDCKAIVEDALRHFDGQRYDLDEFVVMPNHVHALVTPRPGHELSDILHAWKSFTANRINKLTDRSGAFWQKESFDHIIRSPEQLERVRRYIRENPKVEAASSRFEERTRQDAASTMRPAAGTFDGWPKRAAELKVLDPCMGSGHFLVFALPILAAMRQEEEGLSIEDAVLAVLRDNLFGLELDARCTQLAAFNLALAAWRLIGHRPLPPLNLACTGLAPSAKLDDWLKLAEKAPAHRPALARGPIRDGLYNLHRLFSQAPTLGSLINPHDLPADLIAADYETLLPFLTAALAAETADDEARERAVAAAGMVKAAELLAGEYHLVITNVPYLGRSRQNEALQRHCERHHADAKADLANCLVDRCLDLCAAHGSIAVVTPQNWLFLTSYRQLRIRLLERQSWIGVARLGPGAFETIGGHVVNVALLTITVSEPAGTNTMYGLDVSLAKTPTEKAAMLRGEITTEVAVVQQAEQLKNPDARITFEAKSSQPRLEMFAICRLGLGTGDAPHYIRQFWELGASTNHWRRFQTTTDADSGIGGYDSVVAWDNERHRVLGLSDAERKQAHNQDYRGREVWGRRGISVSIMSELKTCDYSGDLFDKLVAAIVPTKPEHLAPIFCYVESEAFVSEVRKLDQKLMVTNATLLKVPFDLAHWRRVAAEKYPNGLPEPESDDPTQWLFHGRPEASTAPLQVAVARLLGYRWPAEQESRSGFQPLSEDRNQRQDAAATMRLSERARALVQRCRELDHLADADGVVPIPVVSREQPAAERVRAMLAAAYGPALTPGRLSQLLAEAGAEGKSLEQWLRDQFFEQHCALFHQRPFIWQIWDGRRDGFSVLVNYHRLCNVEAASSRLQETRQDAASTVTGRRLLEKIIYTYLGDWIARQKADAGSVAGADLRLAAAQTLQAKLEKIAEGEPPYDIFVRWKPLHEQPIGWEPDINDGVRMNIRPWVEAGVLRKNPKIKWGKDRGKDPESAPWFKVFKGERINNHHLTVAEKQAARAAAAGRGGT